MPRTDRELAKPTLAVSKDHLESPDQGVARKPRRPSPDSQTRMTAHVVGRTESDGRSIEFGRRRTWVDRRRISTCKGTVEPRMPRLAAAGVLAGCDRPLGGGMRGAASTPWLVDPKPPLMRKADGQPFMASNSADSRRSQARSSAPVPPSSAAGYVPGASPGPAAVFGGRAGRR